MENKIDFVVLWVDGNDETWLKEKNKYVLNKSDISNQKNRYRDWEILKYWFRGVEENAPWVNNIYFITWGHLPKWLNTSNPKLKIVKHEDFIPKKYLPTFNSNVIQFYLNRIEELSENFVLFDDDIFLIKKTKPTDFFKNGKIRDNFGENVFHISKMGDVFPHSILNNLQCLFENYSKKQFYKKYWYKVFSPKNGLKVNIKTLSTIGYNQFIGIHHQHICMSYTKKHYEKFWKLCKNQLEECSSNKFRSYNDLTTLLVRYIAILDGEFIPRRIKFGKRFVLSNNNNHIYSSIVNRKYNVVCLNDTSLSIDFEKVKDELIETFDHILPNKSSFEK